MLYNDESEKDLLIAKNLSVFFSVFHKISLKDTIAGDGADDTMHDILSADMLVPLVSIDFLSDEKKVDYTAAAVNKGTAVVPVLSRECPWQMNPTLNALADEVLPKGRPFYEYDEKSIDSTFTQTVKKLAEKITGEPLSKKSIVDPFYIYLLIASIVLSIGALLFVYYLFFYQVDMGGFATSEDLKGIGDRYTILFAVAVICMIIITIPLLRLIKPKAITSIFKN